MKKILLALLLTTPAFAADYCMQGGATSKMIDVFVLDSSSTVGAGKSGLAYNTASLACSYRRAGGSRTAITLASSTLGVFTSGAFKEVDATNMPGFYEIGIPDAAIASGVDYVDFWCGGASNMAATPWRVQLNCPAKVVESDVAGLRDGVTTSESTTTLGLASGAVDADDQFTEGFSLYLFNSSGPVGSACIVDSANAGDTVTLAVDLSAVHTVGDSYIIRPDALCRVRAELSSLPGTATYGLYDALSYVYQYLRFKLTETSSEQKLYKDNGSTILETKTMADDGTTATKGEGS